MDRKANNFILLNFQIVSMKPLPRTKQKIACAAVASPRINLLTIDNKTSKYQTPTKFWWRLFWFISVRVYFSWFWLHCADASSEVLPLLFYSSCLLKSCAFVGSFSGLRPCFHRVYFEIYFFRLGNDNFIFYYFLS